MSLLDKKKNVLTGKLKPRLCNKSTLRANELGPGLELQKKAEPERSSSSLGTDVP